MKYFMDVGVLMNKKFVKHLIKKKLILISFGVIELVHVALRRTGYITLDLNNKVSKVSKNRFEQ